MTLAIPVGGTVFQYLIFRTDDTVKVFIIYILPPFMPTLCLRTLVGCGYALMNACLPLITFEPVFAEYYAKKRAEGKAHRVALTHVVKKLLRVIYTLQTKNIAYDPAMIR